MGIHDGHRQRVRNRVRREGLIGFEPHNVLELMLFYALPRGDTNELAHKIMDYFHNDFAAMADSSFEELMKIDGVGESYSFSDHADPSAVRLLSAVTHPQRSDAG